MLPESTKCQFMYAMRDGLGLCCSEHYLIKWGSQGMPRDIEMFNNLKVLYTVSSYLIFSLPGIIIIVNHGLTETILHLVEYHCTRVT